MKSNNIKFIGYIGIFIALVAIYGYIWVCINISIDNIYTIKSFRKDIILSIGMALISTIGFYLKVRLATKNKVKSQ